MILDNEKGTTLIEIIVTTAILVIVSSMFTSFLIFGVEHYESTQKFSQQQSIITNIIMNFREEYERARTVKYQRITPSTFDVSHVRLTTGSSEIRYLRFGFADSELESSTSYSSVIKNTIKNYQFSNTENTWELEYPPDINLPAMLERNGVYLSKNLVRTSTNITIDPSEQFIIFKVQPVEPNKSKFTNRNVRNPAAFKLLIGTKMLIEE